MKKEFTTPKAFQTSLEQRLLKEAQITKIDYQRLRKKIAFDRALARIFNGSDQIWYLKGGYSIEVRSEFARATRDIDLSVKIGLDHKMMESSQLHQKLQAALSIDLNDFFEYFISSPKAEINAAPYGGARFQVEARIGGKTFEKFPLDVGIGDYTLDPLEEATLDDVLSFAGIGSTPDLSKHFCKLRTLFKRLSSVRD